MPVGRPYERGGDRLPPDGLTLLAKSHEALSGIEVGGASRERAAAWPCRYGRAAHNCAGFMVLVVQV